MRIEGVGIDDRGHGVGCIVEAVHEFEAKGNEQSERQEHIRQDARRTHLGEIADKVGPDPAMICGFVRSIKSSTRYTPFTAQ